MSKKRRKNERIDVINNAAEAAKSTEEIAENVAAAKPAEDAYNEEREISATEQKKLHELFKFDWELEENILEALDEDAAELTDDSEMSEPETPQVKTLSLAQVAHAVFGLFLIVFSIIGICATAFKISDMIKAQKDNSEQLQYFESFVMPLVAGDTPIFDGAASLNEDVIIASACWDVIFNPSIHYEQTNGVYKVSYIDIDRRITKLFGSGLSYTHKTVGDIELTFEYDEVSGMYLIPAYPRSPAYYPEVCAISNVQNGMELTVKYRLPITNWIGSLDTVEKTMIYTVVLVENGYNITAVRIGEISGTTGEI